jgi:hypothetical protein
MEALETRAHLDATPYHLQLAEQLVANISPENNVYSYDTPVVTWAGLGGAKTYSNSSDCSTFNTLLLEQAYGFTSRQFVQWTGSSLPQAVDLYDAAIADRGFKGFSNVANVVPGDNFFVEYLDSTTDTGHCATIVSDPTLVSVTGSQRTYDMTVIDCTSDPHSDDTRTNGETGVGEGTMRIYTDSFGNLTAYSWGASDESVIETPATRPAIFAEIPVAPEPSSLAALGGAALISFLRRRPERSRNGRARTKG